MYGVNDTCSMVLEANVSLFNEGRTLCGSLLYGYMAECFIDIYKSLH